MHPKRLGHRRYSQGRQSMLNPTTCGDTLLTERMVQTHQYCQGAQVVYGDTDSLFIRFDAGLADAFIKGKKRRS